jgi:hypothetical protein
MSALDTQARRDARESILELVCAAGVRNGLAVRNIVKNTTTLTEKRVGFRNDPECGGALLKGTETRGALEILPLVLRILLSCSHSSSRSLPAVTGLFRIPQARPSSFRRWTERYFFTYRGPPLFFFRRSSLWLTRPRD